MIQHPAILTDITKCIGCEECVAACKKINGLPVDDAPPRPGSTPDGLSADRWTTVIRKPDNHFVRKQCRHCESPACVSVCPVGALQKTPEGPVIYDKSICMGCRYCMLGCPFGIPHYEWSSVAPSVRKCILCYPHLKSGKVQAPACVTACPRKATIFGTREEMLREAWRRVKAEPSKYIQRVWGEKVVGGTAVLCIGDISLDFLGWNEGEGLGDKPLPQNTWDALKMVPFEFVGMGALMGAIYWIIERRRALAPKPLEGAESGLEGAAMENRRIFVFKGILWLLCGLAAAVAILRMAFGLGTATALSDTTPWGLWVGFDVMGGVALAAGGFVIAALVHIFHAERYHAAARPAILTAFLGYGAVAVGLLFDLGLPWNIWHMIIFWNPRSPLFEVGWCVMLYLTVLALEVAPTILERTPFQKAYRFFARLALPIMILGIMLSTLHQSSLGSLLLIMPFRVHPLWYTHLLPEIFFVSAICLGLNMVMFESSVTSWLYRRKPELHMLSGLAKIASWALSFYLVFKLADLWMQGKLGMIFSGTWESRLFLFEMLISTVLPIALYALPAVRRSPTALWLTSMMSVLGFVLNRIDASGIAQVWATRNFYFPAWTEFAISLGIVSACGLVFFFIQEHFPVDPHELDTIERQRADVEKSTPRFAPFTQVWLGEGWRKSLRVYSMLFVMAMAVGLTLAPKSEPVLQRPVQRARGSEVLRVGDGPRFVYFDHKRHQDENGAKDSCALCHHLHKAGDVGTPCSECHRALFTPTDTFDHDLHIARLGGNHACVKCHGEKRPLVLGVVKKCQGCHDKDMMAPNPVVKVFKTRTACGFKDAMHKMCIPCHAKKATDPKVNKPDLGRCGACHNDGTESEKLYRAAFPPKSKGAILP